MTHRLPTDTDDGLLVVISGPSGVGKTTITRAVERSIPGAVFSVSCTTRPRAAGDVDGVDYHFLTRDEFDRRIAAGDFLEWAEVFGHRYGTPRGWAVEQVRRGRLVILEIDVRGAVQVRARMPGVFGLFILPPDEAALLARLRARKREDEAGIQRRFAEARREIAEARASGAYDQFIVNDNLDQAIAAAVKAVREARRGRRTAEGPP